MQNGGNYQFTNTRQPGVAHLANGGNYQFNGGAPQAPQGPPQPFDPPRPGNQYGHQYAPPQYQQPQAYQPASTYWTQPQSAPVYTVPWRDRAHPWLDAAITFIVVRYAQKSFGRWLQDHRVNITGTPNGGR